MEIKLKTLLEAEQTALAIFDKQPAINELFFIIDKETKTIVDWEAEEHFILEAWLDFTGQEVDSLGKYWEES